MSVLLNISILAFGRLIFSWSTISPKFTVDSYNKITEKRLLLPSGNLFVTVVVNELYRVFFVIIVRDDSIKYDIVFIYIPRDNLKLTR